MPNPVDREQHEHQLLDMRRVAASTTKKLAPVRVALTIAAVIHDDLVEIAEQLRELNAR